MELRIEDKLKKEYPFKSNFLNISNAKLHYLDEGPKDATPIIMVHGNPTWSFYYRNLVKHFSQNYRVIVPDHMGCGLSSKPEDYQYTLENRVKDLTYLLEELDLKKYHMIVHDWGGAIGFGHAVLNTEKILSMTVLNTAAFTIDYIPWQINLCKVKPFGPFAVKYLNSFCYPATFMTTERKLSKLEKAGYMLPYKTASMRKAVVEFVQDIPMKSDHPSYSYLKNIETNLSKLTCPKMFLWGGKDFCFNDRFFNKWKSIYSDAKYHYFEDAGHYVIEDKKEECMALIKSFLEKK